MFYFIEKYVRIFCVAIIFMLSSLIFILVCLLLLPSRTLRIKVCIVYGHIMGSAVHFLLKVKPVIKNKNILNDSFPAIYIANHTSTLDLFTGPWLAPVGTVGISKKEIVYVPFFGWLYLLSGHLLIDRGNREKAIASMNNIVKLVKKYNLSIWIWPEGTRSKDGRLQPLKKGFAHLAINTQLPLVPIVIHNAHKKWPRKGGIQFTKEPLDIEILPKIDTSGWSLDKLDDQIEMTYQLFAEHLSAEQKPLDG